MTAIVGWALVHFVWQGALVGVALAMALALTGQRAAGARYLVSVGALVVMVLLPVATGTRLAMAGGEGTRLVFPAASAAPTGVVGERAGTPPAAEPVSRSRGKEVAGSRGFDLRGSLERAMPWLVGVWVIGVVGLALRLLGGWAWAIRLTCVGTRQPSESLRAMLDRLVHRLRVSRPVRLLESTVVQVPAVVGWLRPVLLVPVSLATGLTAQQIEVLLAHELAHVRRHDYVVNLLQAVIETLLFYHPAVWWVSRRIREEREHCCDDIAVAACGDPRAYAGALLELERLRTVDLRLVAAATGGSLFRRVRRLVTPAPAHAEMRYRWVAGALVVAGVLAVAGGARFSRAMTIEEPQAASPKSQGKRQLGPAEPDTVILWGAEGSLRDRWRAATDAGRRFRTFWLGYAVAGADPSRWVYFDRNVPVVAGESTFLSGHIRFSGDLGQVTVDGVRLEPLVGTHAARDLVMFFGFTVAGGRVALDQIHVSSFAFPVHFGGRAVLWLGQASDPESVELVSSLYGQAGSRDLRYDVVAATGVHGDPAVVVPALRRWLESNEPDDLRAEVADWLGHHSHPAALAALSHAARNNRASRVREEAAEAIGQLDLPGALDTLISLARTLGDAEARREAVEALGERSDDRAVAALAEIMQSDLNADVRREAVETLGDLADGRGVPQLVRVAESHPDAEVRREAVETLGHAGSTTQAIEVLNRIAWNDRHTDVQREAVETLGEIEDLTVASFLVEIIDRHPNVEVQREAVESLGERHDRDPTALERVAELARRHPRVEVQREAIETYAEHASGPEAAELLAELVRSGPTQELRIDALEALSELHDADGITAVLEVARTHPDREIRMKAVSLLAESDDPRAQELIERLLKRP